MSDMQNAAPRPAAYCRTCGKGLYEPLPRAVNGIIYCEEHLPMTTQNPAAAEPPSPYTSPYVGPDRRLTPAYRPGWPLSWA
jgi:hypothetical protein